MMWPPAILRVRFGRNNRRVWLVGAIVLSMAAIRYVRAGDVPLGFGPGGLVLACGLEQAVAACWPSEPALFRLLEPLFPTGIAD